MKIAHYFERSRCIYCGAESPETPMCRINGKSVAIGEQASGGREPFRSFLSDDAAITKRHDEIFLQVPVIGLLLGNREGVFLRTK